MAGAVSAASRLPAPLNRLARVDIPDLMRRPAPRVAIKSVRWAEGAAILARTLPASRTIFILRHPCGQVASVMRGNRQLRFDLKTEGTDMPFDEAGHTSLRRGPRHQRPIVPGPARSGKICLELARIQRTSLRGARGSAKCPRRLVRSPVRSAANPGAPHPDIRRSGLERADRGFCCPKPVHQGMPDIMRFSAMPRRGGGVAKTMPPADQDAVRSVVAASPLARFWPDLMSAPA